MLAGVGGDEGPLDPRPRLILEFQDRPNEHFSDATMRFGLRLEVWIAMAHRYPTAEDAYFARDEEMIRSADRVLAFWDGESAGTAHELTYARRLSKPIDLVLVDRSESPNRYPGGDAA